MVETKSCRDNHTQILYTDEECPLCLERERMDELLDAKTDIEEQNIFELDRRVTKLEKHMAKLVPGAYSKRSWLPFKKAQSVQQQPVQPVEFDG